MGAASSGHGGQLSCPLGVTCFPLPVPPPSPPPGPPIGSILVDRPLLAASADPAMLRLTLHGAGTLPADVRSLLRPVLWSSTQHQPVEPLRCCCCCPPLPSGTQESLSWLLHLPPLPPGSCLEAQVAVMALPGHVDILLPCSASLAVVEDPRVADEMSPFPEAAMDVAGLLRASFLAAEEGRLLRAPLLQGLQQLAALLQAEGLGVAAALLSGCTSRCFKAQGRQPAGACRGRRNRTAPGPL